MITSVATSQNWKKETKNKRTKQKPYFWNLAKLIMEK
jgi:hypothetical protein